VSLRVLAKSGRSNLILTPHGRTGKKFFWNFLSITPFAFINAEIPDYKIMEWGRAFRSFGRIFMLLGGSVRQEFPIVLGCWVPQQQLF